MQAFPCSCVQHWRTWEGLSRRLLPIWYRNFCVQNLANIMLCSAFGGDFKVVIKVQLLKDIFCMHAHVYYVCTLPYHTCTAKYLYKMYLKYMTYVGDQITVKFSGYIYKLWYRRVDNSLLLSVQWQIVQLQSIKRLLVF